MPANSFHAIEVFDRFGTPEKLLAAQAKKKARSSRALRLGLAKNQEINLPSIWLRLLQSQVQARSPEGTMKNQSLAYTRRYWRGEFYGSENYGILNYVIGVNHSSEHSRLTYSHQT